MTASPQTRSIDAALIAQIARRVVQQLREAESAESGPAERLITIETLDRYAGTAVIHAAPGAVITPAAREEAAVRKIQIVTAAKPATTSVASTTNSTERDNDAFAAQLQRRGIRLPLRMEVIWSDVAAAEVHRKCKAGRRAVMVSDFADVQRFQRELSPNVWVIDRHKANLTAAVNIAAHAVRVSASARKNKA